MATLAGALEQVNEHEAKLMRMVPFTPSEAKKVHDLFNQERGAIRCFFDGTLEAENKSLLAIRRSIADERVEISRKARNRAEPTGQYLLFPANSYTMDELIS